MVDWQMDSFYIILDVQGSQKAAMKGSCHQNSLPSVTMPLTHYSHQPWLAAGEETKSTS